MMAERKAWSGDMDILVWSGKDDAMLFEELRPADNSTLSASPERQLLVEALLADFRRAYPVIDFSLVPEFNFLNAQALHFGSRKLVKLYGGLAFNFAIGEDALMFALLHETGHHFATGSRLVLNPRLACECASDLWAINEGAATLLERTGRSVDIAKALNDLNRAIQQQIGSGQIESPASSGHSPNCWAMNWEDRKKSILSNRGVDTGACPLAELMFSASSPLR
jgi:hypothetical protein